MIDTPPAVEVEADDELTRLFAQYADLKTIRDEIVEAVAEVRDRITERLPDHATVTRDGIQLGAKTTVFSTRIDSTKLRKVYPEVAADVEKTTVSVRLTTATAPADA